MPLCLALGAFHPLALAFADEKKNHGDDLEEELRFLKAESVVVTASKTAEPANKSVATVSVIPERQIRQMGARNLLDVLRTVPGLGIGQSASSVRQIEARGIMSTFSERVLVMLNGHPVDHNLFWGGSTMVYDDLPIDNIKRVEVVRGPGSALYGANAFLATINVITKEAKDINGAAVAVGGGSFDTQQYNGLFGKQAGDWHAMANMNYSDSEGPSSPLQSDALGQPGKTHLNERRRDLEWRLGYGEKAVIDGRFISKDTGSFVGPSGFLSNDSRFDHNDFFIRGTLEHHLTENLKLTGRGYHSLFDMDQLLEFRPNNFYNFRSLSQKTGGELQSTYQLAADNTLIGGITYESQQHSGVNQDIGTSPDTLLPAAPFARDATRELWGIYLQDLWDVTDSLRVMMGGRYDDYSDFGDTFNPRMGFNWAFMPDYSLRFSYGTAFRAPTFSELYSRNNPTVLGNPDLKPETIDTYEVGFNANWTPRANSTLTLFRNDVDQMIDRQIGTDALGNTIVHYANVAGIQSSGVEFASQYRFSENSYISFNYTYQDSHYVATAIRVKDTPEHRGTVQGNIALTDKVHWYSEALIKGQTTRAAGDPRQDTPGYVQINTTLRTPNILPGLELNFSVFNLLDHQAVYPYAVPAVRDDFPQAGRTFFAKLRYDLPF